jgi:aspartyl protease family protein
MKLDPSRDRPLRHIVPKRRTRVIVPTFLVLILVGAGFLYWLMSAYYSGVYAKLKIPPLPLSAEVQPQLFAPLNQLRREPCFQDAVIELADALLDAGYPRESAETLLAFVKRCTVTNKPAILVRAYTAFKKTGDLSGALVVVNELVEADPADPQYRYSRGATYEQLGEFAKALPDYIAALQLLGTPYRIAGGQFYDISRMYAALGRYCDAISPIETFISYDPVERQTPQTAELISEYARKGSCEARYVRGVGRQHFLSVAGGVHALSVMVNGIPGSFILDTGASFVTVTTKFSAKARLRIEAANELPMKTASGMMLADLGYANVMSVGSADAEGVAVAVAHGSDEPFGSGVDGLLGMTFLARFNLQLSQDGVLLTPRPLR